MNNKQTKILKETTAQLLAGDYDNLVVPQKLQNIIKDHKWGDTDTYSQHKCLKILKMFENMFLGLVNDTTNAFYAIGFYRGYESSIDYTYTLQYKKGASYIDIEESSSLVKIMEKAEEKIEAGVRVRIIDGYNTIFTG